jgi:hypothetical protein
MRHAVSSNSRDMPGFKQCGFRLKGSIYSAVKKEAEQRNIGFIECVGQLLKEATS